ncbi:hypothetical protein BDY19DRAFT_1038840 [Irpex rosettiformis]|uniref:Uncharacterized protein n=1 Tax=Irpex rosettiformis TaxID=378272 RepID=A0ACB8ULV4_9APHY|nr:hypothetical protein BDY19DRAFT_1038840 [Irpex rosettiformis]
MPKSSKHKKERAADFSKAKLKLGKGKQTPTNAVDTSFKARSIALPSQNIAAAKDGLGPTTKRKLTLDDLIIHLKHYNSGIRKDALLGLRELFEDHPEIISLSLTPVLNGCIRLIADEDASVRKGLLSFLNWLLHRIPRDDLIPHAHLLLLFTTSAQTHIFPEIRIDAIRFLDLCLEVIPEVVIEGWEVGFNGHGRRVMEGYLGILNAGTAYNEPGDRSSIQATSTASVILSPASKLVILKSLLCFLSTALSGRSILQSDPVPSIGSSAQVPTPAPFMSSSFTSSTAFASFDALLQPKASKEAYQWTECLDNGNTECPLIANNFAHDGILDSWSIDDLTTVELPSPSTSDQVAESSRGVRPETAYLVHLLRTLHPILASTFLDHAPTVFSPNSAPAEIDLQTICTIARIAQRLYGSVQLNFHSAANDLLIENLTTLINHMTVYFPFNGYWSVTTKRDTKVEQALQDLNFVFCELTSYLMNTVSHQTPAKHLKKRRAVASSIPYVSLAQIDRVSRYIVKALKGEGIRQGPGSALPRFISTAAYVSILPTVWALLNSSDEEHVNEILHATIEHAIYTSSTSAVKMHIIEFLGRLVLLETVPEYCGQFRLSSLPQLHKALEDWLIQLPKTIWELGSQNMNCTEIILHLLLRLIQRNSPLISHRISVSISARLMPYFIIVHHTHGKVSGPFSKLPQASAIRRLVMDLAYSFSTVSCCEGFEEAVMEGCSKSDREYWLSISS